MAKVKIVKAETVADGDGGFFAVGKVVNLPDEVATNLIQQGYAALGGGKADDEEAPAKPAAPK